MVIPVGRWWPLFDWKPYYRRELEEAGARDYLAAAFARAEEAESLAPLIDSGAILSFPHTALRYAGPLQARVIVGLHRAGIERVVALGVFHAWGHASSRDDYATAMNKAEKAERRKAAFARLRGAFIPSQSTQRTPFGDLSLDIIPSVLDRFVRRDSDGLLQDEFSLDTFMSLLLHYYRMRDANPPSFMPAYIGMTRDPLTGSFATATQVATALRELLAPGTAIVATGDLVHYGTAYTPLEGMEGMSKEKPRLTEYFRGQVERALHLSLREHDHAGAFRLCDVLLNNDQRYLLPVVSELLPTPADYELIAFELSDYTTILKVGAPCVVASALAAYVPQNKKEVR